jgi:two-component system NtrC family sensor kinase
MDAMSIRFRLMTAAAAVILVANSLLSFVTLQYLGRVWLGEVQTRVRRNLNSARAAYQNHLERIAAFLQGRALDESLARAVEQDDRPMLAARLRDLHRIGGMDFAMLLDATGRVLYRAQSQTRDDDLSSDPIVAIATRQRQVVSGTVVLSRERLLAEGNGLADRARFELIPIPAERPTPERERSEGMVVAAAVPVLSAQGRVTGFLYGGDLLNRRYEIVDAIKRQVFPHEEYRGKPIGTVTIFQHDLRISTNVTMDDGARAVGTRLSASVCEAVLDRGGTWAAPAFVVNDWYITAYEPIRDPAGNIVGVLYVGLLQAPFADQWSVIRGVFLAVVGGATLAILVILFVANALVLRPVQLVVAMAQKVIAGDLTARVGIEPPGELGVLCQAVDRMADAVAQREELLKQATRQQISRSEQLASVGRLAAGVAHEINNPLTGVLGFAELLRQKENLDDQDRQDLDVIIRETKRAREIVRGLLDYARETPSIRTRLDLNDVIRQTVRLLGNREAFEQIVVVEDLAEDLPPIDGDRNQLQQVFLNLSLNACEAMPQGGTLLVSTSCDGDRVVVKVTDTGCGIKKEHLDQIFEPFFTTKPVGKGTGLGLSVSSGIVHQHGGTLDVESEEGKGSTFTVTLPVAR